MFCSKCGNELKTGANFCAKCGNRVEQAGEPAQGAKPGVAGTPAADPIPAATDPILTAGPVPAGPAAQQPPVMKPKKRVSRVVIITGIIAAVLTVLLSAFVALGGVDKIRAMGYLNTGNRYLDDLAYEEAIVAFQEVISIEPKEEKAYIGLADAYVGLGDYESAVEALESGLEATDSAEALLTHYEEVISGWDEVEPRFYGTVHETDAYGNVSGAGIAGVYVNVTDGSGHTVTYYTDQAGSYETGHMAPGTYAVSFGAEGYIEYTDEIHLTGGRLEHSVNLERNRKLSGYVYAVDTDLDDTNNAGIADAYVYVTDAAGASVTYQTDAAGYYESEQLMPGNYDLLYYADGYVMYRASVEVAEEGLAANVFLEPDVRAALYGSVQIADTDTDYSNNLPLTGADISVTKLNGSTPFTATASTNENGQYVVEGLLMGVYSLQITKEGFLPVEQTVIIYEGQSVSYTTVVEMVGTEWDGVGTASGRVYDALTGDGAGGLTMTVRAGISSLDGEVLGVFETDQNGFYQTPELESGNYCIEISDNREGVEEHYLNTMINIKVLGGVNIGNQDGTVSTTIQTGQVRIVLTWGATPTDLDSHLLCEMNNGSGKHIYFGDKTFYYDGERIADLDLDDTNSYGPETTTIYRDDPGEYDFFVHNYSRGGDYVLANSGACVQVYMGYSSVPSYVFYVPGGAGYYWEVFHYSSVTGILTPVNTMTY